MSQVQRRERAIETLQAKLAECQAREASLMSAQADLEAQRHAANLAQVSLQQQLEGQQRALEQMAQPHTAQISRFSRTSAALQPEGPRKPRQEQPVKPAGVDFELHGILEARSDLQSHSPCLISKKSLQDLLTLSENCVASLRRDLKQAVTDLVSLQSHLEGLQSRHAAQLFKALHLVQTHEFTAPEMMKFVVSCLAT
eukprot:1160451-Pelagomonas_calceolata.AAC.6